MDVKAEKIALFRYGLVAPLVLEALPRGELTRRAEEIAARQYESAVVACAAGNAIRDRDMYMCRAAEYRL